MAQVPYDPCLQHIKVKSIGSCQPCKTYGRENRRRYCLKKCGILLKLYRKAHFESKVLSPVRHTFPSITNYLKV
jgi:hypothetical protein